MVRQAGARRTLLFESSDHELGVNTPYFAALAAKTPRLLQKIMITAHGTVPQRLREAGIDPVEVDYLVFDHLHTQDIRRWVGTMKPQADLGPDAPVEPLFPAGRAQLLATLIDDFVLARVSIDGISAVVRGSRANYQVHLHNGSIHVEPGGYRCVVPALVHSGARDAGAVTIHS